MKRLVTYAATAALGIAFMLSPLPAVAKPNILPGSSAAHLPTLSPETIERRKLRKEQRAKAREERRLKRLNKGADKPD